MVDQPTRGPLNEFSSVQAFLDSFARFNVRGGMGGDGSWNNSWYGNESRDECLSKKSTGDQALVPEAESFLDSIDFLQELDLHTAHWIYSPFGAYPDVPSYLSGHPEPMRRKVVDQIETSAIRVVLNPSSSAIVEASDLKKRGLVVAAFVYALSAVRPVEFYLAIDGDGAHNNDPVLNNCSGVLIRLPSSPMNLAMIAWACSSQRLVRDYGYNFINWSNGFRGGYPWNIRSAESVLERSKKFFSLGDDDLYIPAIHVADGLVTQPRAWLKKMLTHYLPKPIEELA